MRTRQWWFVGLWLVLAVPSMAENVVDSFESLAGWSTQASENATVELSLEEGMNGKALRIDFEIAPGGSFVIVRKAVSLTLPKYFAFKMWIRGQAPPNDFQFKLIDKSGRNVWWYRQRPCMLPVDWRLLTVRNSRFEFAWGDRPAPTPREVAFIEFAIAAGQGGRGSLWIDELVWEARRAPRDVFPVPKAEASTFLPGAAPENVLDPDPQTAWHSGVLVPEQWLQVDFQVPREIGAVVVEWDLLDFALEYQLLASEDGERWWRVFQSSHCDGGRDVIPTGETVARYLRFELVRSSRGQGYGIRSVIVKPYELAASPNQFFTTLAGESPPGLFPRYFSGEQTYWTVVATAEGGKQGLLNSDGAFEPFPLGFSVEPFVYRNGALLSWRHFASRAELIDGFLPVPRVILEHEWLRLEVTAVAGKAAAGQAAFLKYEVFNKLAEEAEFRLFLGIRPFQVLPPWQNLNLVGGVSSVRDLAFDGQTVWVNGRPAVLVQTEPQRFGAAYFEEGMVTEVLQRGSVPQRLQVSDPLGYGSAALEYRLLVPAGGSASVYAVVPWPDDSLSGLTVSAENAEQVFALQLARAREQWRERLQRVEFELPAEAAEAVAALRASIGYILAHRDGPALQPGPRTYARAWIRDGASMAAALLQMGATDEARAFARWFAQFQLPDGRIPCCVDRRGSDPVPEHDANGEFVFLVAEIYRFTRDIGLVADLWPAVVRAVEWIERNRAQRMTPEYRAPAKAPFYGLLTESISHEGYAAKPVHSYWDDFWALRGLKDAATLASVMGAESEAATIAALRDDFRRTLVNSLHLVMERRSIDFLPGSVELADFDPNSTAIALYPVDELASLPRPAVERTFRRYLEVLEKRLRGEEPWESYTPYELRNVPALLRLGQREEAWKVLRAVLADRRPAGWYQWPEILWRDPSWPRFVGDMPHAWVSALYIEALRHCFAYERESDASLVLAAGIPRSWVEQGVAVRRLPTHYGVVHFSLRAESPSSWKFEVGGDVHVPAGGLVVQAPVPQPIRSVVVNGKELPPSAEREFRITSVPAEAIIHFAAEEAP